VLFSSLNSIVGGIGLGDYAAANAFLDAFAAAQALRGGPRTVAVNWDAWQEAGMAAEGALPEELAALREGQLAEAIRPEEGREVLARILAAAPVQVAVSTHALSRRIADAAATRLSAALAEIRLPARSTFHPRPPLAPTFVEPASPLETLLAALFRELLGIEPIGRHDGFFEMGGHSLLASQLAVRLREQVGIELPLQAVFSFPTPAQLAAQLAEIGVEAPAAPAPALKAQPRQSRRISRAADDLAEAREP
jgi:phthiocerol/phenolphthiocerol synthesis type-I polyketide synthase E